MEAFSSRCKARVARPGFLPPAFEPLGGEPQLLAAVGEVGEVPNLGPGPLSETMLIRLLVRFAAEPHSPVEMSDGSKDASAVVALVRGHLHAGSPQFSQLSD
jgi:hypothetical protein